MTSFYDMWEVGEVADDGKSCKDDDFKIIKQGGVGVECLKLKKDKYDDDRSEAIAILASRLEKRRYAAYVGCNTEGRKWEGITFDPVGRKMYTAMSSIDKGMESNDKYWHPSNEINLKKNKCGCVMELGFSGDEDYSVAWMRSLVCGFGSNYTTCETMKKGDGKVDCTYDDDEEEWMYDGDKCYCHPEVEYNSCDVDGIANPDNVAMIPEYNQLMIGEDTSSHQNDMIWIYNFNVDEDERQRMDRIATTPYGAETTSPYWYPNLKGGHSYITMVVQHPYGESDEEKVDHPDSTGENGWVGYFGPLPEVSKVEGAASSTPASVFLSAVIAFCAAVLAYA